MANASPDPINILRPGTFVDTNGNRVVVARSHLVDMVDSYDAGDPMPFVFGHPKHDDPAMGWVGKLQMSGDTLQAVPGDVTPELSEALASKRYRKVSASYYQPDNPANPKPGRFMLKHVGLLGAMAPAVKGLGLIPAFAADDETAVTIPQQESTVTDTPEAVALSERETAIEAREASIAERESATLEREAAIIAAEKIATQKEHVSFAEAQVVAGRLAPAGKDKVIGLMGVLAASGEPVSFGEGEEAVRPIDAFRQLLEGGAPVVNFGEAAPADQTVEQGEAESPEQLASRAVAFAESEKAAGREITIQAAVRHCHQNPPA